MSGNVTPAECGAVHRLAARVAAFARDAVIHGDMTPAARRMLTRILEEEEEGGK